MLKEKTADEGEMWFVTIRVQEKMKTDTLDYTRRHKETE